MNNLCSGTNVSMGGVQGASGRGRKSSCPVCGRRIGMRPGRAGRLYPHNGTMPSVAGWQPRGGVTVKKMGQLTPRQADVLGIVKAHRSVTASEVGEYHLPIGYSAAYRALMALEEKGLIGATYTTGQRGRAFYLTRKGAEALAELHGAEDDARE